MLLFMTNAGVSQEENEGYQAGDTIYYKVSQWQVPDILSMEDNGTELGVDLDLTNARVALKILSVDQAGYWLGAYGKLTRVGSVNFASPEMNEITIPIPVGLSGPFLTESYFSFTPWVGGDITPPIWVKNAPWSLIENWADNNEELDFNDDGTTVTITIELALEMDEQASDLSLSMSYAKNEDDAFFQSLTLEGTIEEEEVKVELTQDGKEYLPLSEELDVGDVLRYDLIKADAVFSLVLNDIGEDFINTLVQDQTAGKYTDVQDLLDDLALNITAMKDKTIFEYRIDKIDGIFYNTTLSQLNFDTDEMEEVGSMGVNGFVGSQPLDLGMLTGLTELNLTEDLLGGDLDELSLSTDSFMTGIGIPVSLSPDWDMWEGLFDQTETVQTLVSLLTTDQTSSDIGQLYSDLGFTKNPSIAGNTSWVEEEGYWLSQLGVDLEFAWDASELALGESDETNFTLPDFAIPNFELEAALFQGYTDTGILVGAGVYTELKTTFDLVLDPALLLGGSGSIPGLNLNIPINGDLYLKLDLQLKLSGESEGVNDAVDAANALVGQGGGFFGLGFAPLTVLGLGVLSVTPLAYWRKNKRS